MALASGGAAVISVPRKTTPCATPTADSHSSYRPSRAAFTLSDASINLHNVLTRTVTDQHSCPKTTSMQPFITFAAQKLGCEESKVGKTLEKWSSQSCLIKALVKKRLHAPFLGSYNIIPFREFTRENAKELYFDAKRGITVVHHLKKQHNIHLRNADFPCIMTVRK